MNISLTKNQNLQSRSKIMAVLLGFFSAASLSMPAMAATASFTTSVAGDPSAVAGIANDQGVLVAPGSTVGLLLSEPFAITRDIGNDITIFATSSVGGANVDIRFGRFNGGAPTFVHSQTFNASQFTNSVNFAFLADVGCSNLGGCDFIEFSGSGAFNGSQGVILDAVTFANVPLASVTAGTPEPQIWLLMILAFGLIGWRMKNIRQSLLTGDFIKSLQPLAESGTIAQTA